MPTVITPLAPAQKMNRHSITGGQYCLKIIARIGAVFGERQQATHTSSSAPRTRTRFLILVLISIGTAINYLDRTVLGIAARAMTKELQISAVLMGFVFSAFSWTTDVCGAALLGGGLSYVFMVGDVSRIEIN